MTQLQINFASLSFVKTRARRNDSSTSKDAAKASVSRKADKERADIRAAVRACLRGATARDVSAMTGIDYIECQRRLSECGLTKTKLRRDGCAVWVAVQ